MILGIAAAVCSGAEDFDKCMSPPPPPDVEIFLSFPPFVHIFPTRMLHKRAPSPHLKDYTWPFAGIIFGFMGLALIIGLTFTWVTERMRRGPRKNT